MTLIKAQLRTFTATELLVFTCIPMFWCDATLVVEQIAARTGTPLDVVRHHTAQFIAQRLVEMRASATDIRDSEIRRIASTKDVPMATRES